MTPTRPAFPREDYAPLKLYRPERKPAPAPVDLSDNTNQWGAHPAALRAVQEATTRSLVRYPDFYADALREAAAERWGVAPENVSTGPGSDHILDCAFRVASASGGVVSYAAPSFVMVEVFARVNGRTTRPVPWAEALADPERLLHGDPVLVYVCRPNNPTGTLADGTWLRDLLDAAGPDGPLVLIDEAYAEFIPPEESFVKEAVERGRVLVPRTLSKAFGLAGLRVGVGVASPEVTLEIEKSRGPFMVSTVAEAAGVAVLRDEEGWVTRTVSECIESRGRLAGALEDRGVSPLPSRANFLYVPVSAGRAPEYAAALRERGVAVRPFAASLGVPDGLRVTVGPWPLMERFLEAFDEVLESEGAAER